jgi:hypothetical protein
MDRSILFLGFAFLAFSIAGCSSEPKTAGEKEDGSSSQDTTELQFATGEVLGGDSESNMLRLETERDIQPILESLTSKFGEPDLKNDKGERKWKRINLEGDTVDLEIDVSSIRGSNDEPTGMTWLTVETKSSTDVLKPGTRSHDRIKAYFDSLAVNLVK